MAFLLWSFLSSCMMFPASRYSLSYANPSTIFYLYLWALTVLWSNSVIIFYYLVGCFLLLWLNCSLLLVGVVHILIHFLLCNADQFCYYYCDYLYFMRVPYFCISNYYLMNLVVSDMMDGSHSCLNVLKLSSLVWKCIKKDVFVVQLKFVWMPS